MQPGTRGNPQATILVVGDCYSLQEEREQQPFRGGRGIELEKMLREAGIKIDNCFFTNLINKRPAGDRMTSFFYPTDQAKVVGAPLVRGLYPRLELMEGIERVQELIARIRPRIIIAAGSYVLWALTEADFRIANGTKPAGTTGFKVPTGIGNYRGSQLLCRFGDIPLLPIYAPDMVLRNYAWRFLTVHDLRTRVPLGLKDSWHEPERNFIVRPSFDAAMGKLTELQLKATLSATRILLSVDIETIQRHLECIGIAWSTQDAICIPIMCQDKWEGYWTPDEEAQIMLQIKKLLEHPNVEVVGQNYLYDYQHLWFWNGIKSRYRQDTMLAQHVIYPGTELNLNMLASLYCDYHRYWKDDGKEATKNLDDEKRWEYNCRDCVITFDIIRTQWKILRHYNLQQQYAIQMMRANSALKMMLRGVRMDKRWLQTEQALHLEKMMEFDNKFLNIMPHSVWPPKPKASPWHRSPSQMIAIFYEELGVSPVTNRKTGELTVDDDALAKIKRREPLLAGVINMLQDYRSLEAFGQFIFMSLSKDGRMRCSYSPTTDTGRYRSSEDVFGHGRNLQNIPSGNEDKE